MDPLLQTDQCKCVAYADDLLLIVEGDSRAALERVGCSNVEIVSAWGREVGVDVSISKTVMMILKGILATTRPPSVKLNGVTLAYKKEVKYLGVTIGERMNFRNHLEAIKNKLPPLVGAMTRMTKKEWGIGRRGINSLHSGLFAACALYAVPVWCELLETKTGIRLLDCCERIALLGGVNVCRTVSTAAMEVIGGNLPWRYEAILRTAKYCIKRELPIRTKGIMDPAEVASLERSKVLAALETRLYEKWQGKWDTSIVGRTTHAFIKDVRFSKENAWFFPQMYTGFLLTGHGGFNSFLSTRGLAEIASCVACGDPNENWEHVIYGCPLYADIRREYITPHISVLHNASEDSSSLVRTETAFNDLMRFANEAFKLRKERNQTDRGHVDESITT